MFDFSHFGNARALLKFPMAKHMHKKSLNLLCDKSECMKFKIVVVFWTWLYVVTLVRRLWVIAVVDSLGDRVFCFWVTHTINGE